MIPGLKEGYSRKYLLRLSNKAKAIKMLVVWY